ncbi:MAG: FHA domain-containing protein [Anaerolineales bacterium]
MTHVAVTLEYDRQKIDLALPLATPAREIVEGVLAICKIEPAENQNYTLSLQTESGGIKRIPPSAHLEDVGVLHGALLKLSGEGPAGPRAAPAQGAFLRLDTGEVFAVTGMTVIGRRDLKQGVSVDIDLSRHDNGRTVSRRHATVEHRQGYVVMDLASINGTFLNGKRLAPRMPAPLANGDEIVIGRNGVRLKFIEGERPGE